MLLLAASSVQPVRSGGRGRQVLVGDFSPEDCDDYRARRLASDGQPLMSEPVRRVITGRSHGLPLYLDLSVMRFLELRRTGRTPQPADFDHDFHVLVSRTLSDLTPDERHVLRSVSLLDSFDVPLATRAAGMAHEAPALRLIERPFVREDPFALCPFHLHGLVRSTIRTADDHTDDRRPGPRAASSAGRRTVFPRGPSHRRRVHALSPGAGRRGGRCGRGRPARGTATRGASGRRAPPGGHMLVIFGLVFMVRIRERAAARALCDGPRIMSRSTVVVTIGIRWPAASVSTKQGGCHRCSALRVTSGKRSRGDVTASDGSAAA
ncbi:hypothetical protein [Streptomyces sp. NPDC058466]|uniref:hypothetical protein n=1 Tax=Streptomyces sp. NPDC058466 TaxID=3346512 RepID=UPI003655A822